MTYDEFRNSPRKGTDEEEEDDFNRMNIPINIDIKETVSAKAQSFQSTPAMIVKGVEFGPLPPIPYQEANGIENSVADFLDC